MIRTLVEIRRGRVSIQETGSGTTVTVALDDAPSTVPLGGQEERLYTAEEVAALQTSEARLVAEPLERKVRMLTLELDRRTQERDEREQARANLEADLASLQRELHGTTGPYAALAEGRRVVGKLTGQIQAARELLTTDEVYQARRMDCSRTGTTMGYAIGAALRVMTSPPTPPGPPTDETSQA